MRPESHVDTDSGGIWPQLSTNAPFIRRTKLKDFRCYSEAVLETDSRPVVLTGPNGAGKTNILEAISYLFPGRGLRGARLSEIVRHSNDSTAENRLGWAIAASVATESGDVEIGIGLQRATDGVPDKRIIKIDGQIEKSQAALGRVLGGLWLTPAMDRLFLDSATARRRFVDQLVVGVEPEHAGSVAAYEQSMRNRNRLLRDTGFDPAWMDSLEDSMAQHGIAVAASRRNLVRDLNRYAGEIREPFPLLDVVMAGPVEVWLEQGPALAAEDSMRAALVEMRASDAAAGGSSIGPHRSEFLASDQRSGLAAAQCSTGEQKAMLITLILSAARMLQFKISRAPILLLDEITAHLDETRREAFFDAVVEMGCQAWMTGTDLSLFAHLGDRAQNFLINAAKIKPA